MMWRCKTSPISQSDGPACVEKEEPVGEEAGHAALDMKLALAFGMHIRVSLLFLLSYRLYTKVYDILNPFLNSAPIMRLHCSHHFRSPFTQLDLGLPRLQYISEFQVI